MSQQSLRQAAHRAALDSQAVRRKERADRERRLGMFVVAVLTALGERKAAVRDTERRAGEALQTMTVEEGLSLWDAAEWCGGLITLREAMRVRRLVNDTQARGPDAADAS